MRKTVLNIALLLMSTAAFAAEQFTIDPNHSSANFAVRHMLVSTVKGRFSQLSGSITLDEADMTKSSVTAVIKAASINTDNERRDGDLRSANFFEVEKYPEIKFQSSRVEKTADGYVAVGMLTMKDVSKEVRLPFTYNKAEVRGRTKLGADASTTLNRYDYNIKWDPTGATVGKDVKIEINIEANKVDASAQPVAPPAAAAPKS